MRNIILAFIILLALAASSVYITVQHDSSLTGTGDEDGVLGIATGGVTLAHMADIATSSLIYRKTAGSGVPEVNTLATLKTDLGLTGTNSGDQAASSSPTASTLALRDANGNASANNILQGYTTTITGGATTTLTVGSTFLQFFTGTLAQTVTLPVTSTLSLGQQFFIRNLSTGSVTINSSGGNLIEVLGPNTRSIVTCILTTGTDAGSWGYMYIGFNVASGKVLTVSNSLTLAGTDGTTMTFPTTSATLARTDAANTFTGVQTMTSPSFTTPVLGTPASGTLTNCTIPASALTGATLAAGVTGSSLTSVGTLASPTLTTPTINGSKRTGVNRFACAVVTGAVARTLSGAEMAAGSIQELTGTTARIFTLDTGTNLSTAVPGVAVGDAITFYVKNSGTSTGTITMAGGTGTTLTSTAIIAIGTSRLFYAVNTGTNTWTIY